MSAAGENIQPTRGELLKLKRRIDLAERGHELLREKRDALITEFFDNLSLLRERREKVDERLENAFEKLVKAKVTIGTLELEEAAEVTKSKLEIDIDSRNIMGVKVPIIEAEGLERKNTERGYSIQQTSSTLDEASKEFEKALRDILELAEAEETVKQLAKNIEKTKRRVNSLEHILIPRLEDNRDYIEMRLEEQERETYFRLKRVKEKME
ncbi:ATP synthase subunit D [candidate division MSBL1 archaeon SCGC-AAA382M17]|uniref:A-type ATP synthase subunit D n=1 Tax=candidate division MSBL1 archaeon SCGC-AAA382M17 TaxID=1698284 RepID=A0ABR5TJ68_9EURY|nr:ATP synthase subunit D [candidate division MSBL1 archaeon SCGC-AAA382M17]